MLAVEKRSEPPSGTVFRARVDSRGRNRGSERARPGSPGIGRSEIGTPHRHAAPPIKRRAAKSNAGVVIGGGVRDGLSGS